MKTLKLYVFITLYIIWIIFIISHVRKDIAFYAASEILEVQERETLNTATGSIISVSTNQPCQQLATSQNTPQQGNTERMACNTATILELGVSPGIFADETGTASFSFLAFPDGSSQSPETFSASSCTSGGGETCKHTLNNDESIMTIDISISPMIARYQLSDTGITIPFSYLYHTCLSQSATKKAEWNSCGQCPAPQPNDIAMSSNWFYANNGDGSIYWTQTSLQATAFACPDSEYSQQLLGRDPTKGSGLGLVVDRCGPKFESNIVFPRWINGTLGCGGALDEYDAENPCTMNIINTCTQPLESGKATKNVCPGGPLQNYEQRNNNIYRTCCQSGNCAGTDDALCPLHSGLVYGSSRCVMSGLNAKIAREYWADGDNFIALVKDSTTSADHGSYGDGNKWDINDPGNAQSQTQKFMYACQDCAGSDNLKYGVIREPGTYYTTDQNKDVTVHKFEVDLDTMTDPKTCGCFLVSRFFNDRCASIKTDDCNTVGGSPCQVSDDKCRVCQGYQSLGMRYTNYPVFVDQKQCTPELASTDLLDASAQSRWASCIVSAGSKRADMYAPSQYDQDDKECWYAMNPVDHSNIGKRFRLFLNSDGARFDDTDGCVTDSEDVDDGKNPIIPEEPPRNCACNAAFYDTIIPVGPTCTVYSIATLADPIYNVTATVKTVSRTNQTESEYTLEVGTLSKNSEGVPQITLKDIDVSSDQLVQLKLEGVDYPRGSVIQDLDGYIVVCGDTPIFKEQQRPRQEMRMAHTEKNPAAFLNPWKLLNDIKDSTTRKGPDSSYRYPLPSTLEQMQAAGVIDDAIYNQLGLKIDSYNDFETRSFSGDGGQSYAWWYYVPPEQMAQYGKQCNQNGFVSYGHYDIGSSTQICANRAGTCVPGYDLRHSTYENKTDAQRDPPTKQPCFIARTFVEAELSGTGYKTSSGKIKIPENMPPFWRPDQPNIWIDKLNMLTDTKVDGTPYYNSQNALVRLTLSVAGTLIGESVSFSSGHLEYTNGLSEPVTNQPLSDCVISGSTLMGTAKLLAYNDGDQLSSSYSIDFSCADGVASQQSDNTFVTSSSGTFQLTPGQSAVVPIPVIVNNVSLVDDANRFTCEAFLRIGGISSESGILSSLPVECVLTQNDGGTIGKIVDGTGPGSDDSDQNDPGDPDQSQNTFCSTPVIGWLCTPLGWIGDVEGYVETFAIYVGVVIFFFIVLIITCCFTQKIEDSFQQSAMRQRELQAVAIKTKKKLKVEISKEKAIEGLDE